MKKKNKYSKFYCCFILSLLTSIAFANASDIRFRLINVDDNLSSNQVNTFCKDNLGFLWIGTRSGLNRYDGYTLKTYKHNPKDSTSLMDNYVRKVVVDANNMLWVLSPNSKLCLYDPIKDQFIHNLKQYDSEIAIPQNGISDINVGNDGRILVSSYIFGAYIYDVIRRETVWIKKTNDGASSIDINEVSCIRQGKDGYYWLVNRNGIIEKVDSASYKVVHRKSIFSHAIDEDGENFRLFVDHSNDVWVYSESNSLGVAYYDHSEDKLIYFSEENGDVEIASDVVKEVVQDAWGTVWIGMDHGGINLFDKTSGKVTSVKHIRGELNSLPENSITTLYLDKDGIMWVGMYKGGVAYHHPDFFKFKLYHNNPFDNKSITSNDINAFAEDDKGNIWIGSNGGGLIYFDQKTKAFSTYKHHDNSVNSLSKDVVISLLYDSKERLWIGTYFGGLDVYKNGYFKHYKHQPKRVNSLANDRIWSIFEDSRGLIWIGTLGGGLELYDDANDSFVHYKHGDVNSVGSNFIYSIEEDVYGNLWFGTIYGIDVLNWESQRFIRFEHDIHTKHTLSDNKIIELKCDSRGLMWVGTTDGLNIYDEQTHTFRTLRQDDGLADNSILGIEEDDLGHLWVMTPKGLTEIFVGEGIDVWERQFVFNNYDQKDGLEKQHFNERASLKMRSGHLVFGGVNGFNQINPSEIEQYYSDKQVRLLQFKLFNKTVGVNEKVANRVLLKQSLSTCEEITLKYNENIFAISFAAVDFFHPSKLIYEYRLDGFNEKWFRASSNNREATYTNLNPGVYRFNVRVSENGVDWYPHQASIQIKILPPFWANNWAFLVYFCLIVCLLIAWRYLFLKKEHLKIVKRHEIEEVNRMAKLNDLKFRFFTNVSHEFRTPLTLIITPLKKLIANTTDPLQVKQLKIIERNGMRLLNLVNQLLDFRKLEVDQLKLCVSSGDIVQFVKDKVESFVSYSENKGVSLQVVSDIEEYNTFFDHDKIEKIIYNLLSNAFKFTLKGGEVNVHIALIEKESMILIQVRDTGMGIDPSMLDRIFDRFTQDEHQEMMLNQGSGIGLSLTKEFVELHGGRIEVESTWGEGSLFSVFIPSDIKGECIEELESLTAEESTEDTCEDAPKTTLEEDQQELGNQNDKPLLLIVEDNDDLRSYLSDNLSVNYRIEEACNGQEGYDLLQKEQPVIIICDVMMPIMDGKALCKKVKRDDRFAHIPFILLTAATSLENELEGLEVGADDYITKPFNYDVLELKISNIIARRKRLHATFSSQRDISPSEICVTSLDEKFFEKALKTVNDNLSDSEFSIEKMGKLIGISRAHLYNKLMAITGKTPAEFIKIMRLKRASQLLRESQLTIAEVSYEVGYNGPRYFTKHFKDFYGQTPSQYVKEEGKNHSSSLVDEKLNDNL